MQQRRRPGLHRQEGLQPDGEVDDVIRLMLRARRGMARYEGEIRRLLRRAQAGGVGARDTLWRRWRCRIVGKQDV